MDEQNIRSEDYISLGVFKRILVQLLYGFFAFVHYIFKVINKGKLLLAAALVAGLIVGYSYYTSRARYYEVSMVAMSTELNNSAVAEIVRQLNLLAGTGSHKQLAAALNLSESEGRQISYIVANTLANEPLETDTSSKIHRPFTIVARINDTTLTNKLQQALIFYFNNSPYLKYVKENETKMYEERLAFLNAELANLDTLKKNYNHLLASGKVLSNDYNSTFDPGQAYEYSLDVADEKLIAQRWLTKDRAAIDLIDQFKSRNQPQSYSLFKSMMTTTLIFLGCAFLLALFIQLDKTSKKYAKME